MIFIVDTNYGQFVYRGTKPLKDDKLKEEIRKVLNGKKSHVQPVGEKSSDSQSS